MTNDKSILNKDEKSIDEPASINSRIVVFKTDDEQINIDVLFKDDTVWLTQELMCQLFQKSKSTISEHISNVFAEKELEQNSVVRKFRTTAIAKNYLDEKELRAMGQIVSGSL